jgi:hypothetical protein
MSYARGNSRGFRGQRPGPRNQPAPENSPATQSQGGPQGPQWPFPRKEKDDLRTKIIKAKSRYEELCDSADNQRFRVRAEILDNSEDYITVQMGCNMRGVITLPWAEYSSADLEIRFGSQLDLVRKVKMMMRRSVERLGYSLGIQDALDMRGTADADQLLMSNKEWKALSEQPVAPAIRVQRPVAPQVPPPSGGTGYYAQSSAEASRVMNERFQALFPGDAGIAQDWASQESTDSNLRPSVLPPPTQQRGSRDDVEAAHGQKRGNPAGGGKNPITRTPSVVHVPSPSTGPPVSIPAPTTTGGR